ncbi:hypothetical protein N2152v2_005034 [Parachlorella kessleri]
MGLTAPVAHATPQQLLWAKTYKDVKNHTELDSSFEKVKLAVMQHVSLLQRQAQVRVKNWLKKLSEETANVVWKKNRNAFARLLLDQLRAGRLAEPFHQMPPDGPLPTLPKHAAYAFAQPKSPPRQECRPSASEALDEYLGRQNFTQLPLEAEHVEHVALPQPAVADVLPGTRMLLTGPEARQVDRAQLQDTRWQPSKLELEAQLGASRERERELQWRLQQAEDMMRQQGLLLQQAVPARLRSPSPPLVLDDSIDDDSVSPPRRRVGREEEEILEHLDNFQRQTEAIRKQLARRPSSESSLSGMPSRLNLSGMSSLDGLSLGAGMGGGFSGLGTLPAQTVAKGAGGLAPSSTRLEPSQMNLASPTVVDGVTPAASHVPSHLLATTARFRPSRLLAGLPSSPKLGAKGAAHGMAQAEQPSAAATSSSAWLVDRDREGLSPGMPARGTSPPIRHTLKSAAAAQKTAGRASPSLWKQAGTALSARAQEQEHQQQQGRHSSARSIASPQSSSHPGGQETAFPEQQQQQDGWQQSFHTPGAVLASSHLEPGQEHTSQDSLSAGWQPAASSLSSMLLDSRASTSHLHRPVAGPPGFRHSLPAEQSSDEALEDQWRRPSLRYQQQDTEYTSEPSSSVRAGRRGGSAGETPAQLGDGANHGQESSTFAGLESSSGRWGDTAPAGSSHHRSGVSKDTSSLAFAGSGLALDGDPSLVEFRRQTDAIKAQIAALKMLEDGL